MTLDEAVRVVRSGDTLGIGGMGLCRKPLSFVRALARSGVKDLTLLGFTSSFEAELLAAAGTLGTLRTCYFGLEFFGLAPNLRRAVEEGCVAVVEETEYSITVGLQASQMRVPYLPSRDAGVGTGYFAIRPDIRRAACPVTGESLTWFPAVAPRVAVIHVAMADENGNAWLGGQRCIDAQLAMAADITIVTAERIVSTADVRAAQGGAELVSFMVDLVVEAPGGAHPTSCYPDYPLDVVHIARYLGTVRERQTRSYLERYVHGARSAADYLRCILEDRNAAS